MLVGIIVLVLALGTSLYGRKLMGFELILPVQCTYFGLSCLSGVTATIGQLKNLYYSTGYNTIPKASLNENSNYAGLSVIGFQNEFLLNFNFMGAVLVFGCLLVYICNEILTQL